MDFHLDPDSEQLRAEVRAFLEEHFPPELEERVYRSGVAHDDGFAAAMAERGWLTLDWPEEWGGGGREPQQIRSLVEEMTKADAPVYATTTSMMIARAIQLAGNEELKAEILPKARRAEITMVLGFSEPEAGSDVANVQTRARRDGDEWCIDGQKMFTTNAHVADYVFLLTRTNPDVPKHKGLTMFLVPLRQEGVEAQAVYTLSGERTNITYYADVRLSDRYRIGDVDRGWDVLMFALQGEHSVGFGEHLDRLVDDTEAWAHDSLDEHGRPPIERDDVRARLARAATELEVAMLLQRRVAWMQQDGQVPEAEGPMAKLFSTEALSRSAQDLTEVVGPDALRSRYEPTAPRNGRIEHALRFSIGTTIYAGTSEIQRNIIAQRRCGLPR